ncbi:copper homeostasis protein CutC [Saccharibacillus sp. CPCC 101409]|uniref:copper homeostasis protein CutC n=1 Tax=Saccharibacillus sp. CPCC 101409 TaxID=3058041 RepID=UPI00267215E7|nr:copper homeostasis protein CutC [Saccharibacillus sp. CPCC 101409]MDO3408254.1 copper homeostasis protein CutC [Saccharibacillus sp. CPCC 101409]
MLLEVIACTPEEAAAAERGGADRIEWITDPSVGGVTPDLSLAEQMRRAVSVPIRVMVRPRGGGFVYAEDELEQMRRDIRRIAAAGGLDVVTGVLTPEGTVDQSALAGLLNAGPGLAFTFHRAFDEAGDLPRALDELSVHPQVTDVLTSGGAPAAPEGAAVLAELLRRSAGRPPRILAGAGLTAENLRPFLDAAGADRIHIGSAARIGGASSAPIDPARVREIRGIIADWSAARQ